MRAICRMVVLRYVASAYFLPPAAAVPAFIA